MPFLRAAESNTSAKFPGRERQILELQALLSDHAPRPSSVVVHGAEAAGKSSVVKHLLSSGRLPHAIINCEDCVTGRHLLERTSFECWTALEALHSNWPEKKRPSRCESLSALAAHLQQTLRNQTDFVLVFDGIDRQREPPHALLHALVRLAHQINCLTIVFIISVPGPALFHRPGIPHVEFPAYDRDEVLDIVNSSPLQIYPNEGTQNTRDRNEPYSEDDVWLWTRFCAAVWDAFGDAAARDVISFRTLVERLWSPFVSSIVDGTYGSRDFSKLMVAKRALFQNDEYLVDEIGWRESDVNRRQASHRTASDSEPMMPALSIYVLCATYLASYNPSRLDSIYFMEWSEKKRKRRGGKGGGPRGRAPKYQKIPRRALPPGSFPLPRLLAILSAIYPTPLPPSIASDVLTTIASLTACRLMSRAGAGGIGGDALEEGAKWKANVGWDYVVKLGRSVGLEMQDWSAE